MDLTNKNFLKNKATGKCLYSSIVRTHFIYINIAGGDGSQTSIDIPLEAIDCDIKEETNWFHRLAERDPKNSKW